MKIGIIGAGQVGQALGSAWRRFGHDVFFGVRDPEDGEARALADRTRSVVTSPRQAASIADIVILALPWTAAEAAVASLGPLSGKIVIDCMNPLAMRSGRLGLDRGFDTSGAEALAGWLPDARIVKTLNQTGAENMADAGRLDRRPVMFLAGDDADAKRVVEKLVNELGFETLDAGGLIAARLLEPLAMVWINQALIRGEGRDWALGVVRPSRAA